jgi:hypothetical protein
VTQLLLVLGKISRNALCGGRYKQKHFVTASFSQFAHNAPQRFQHGCVSAWGVVSFAMLEPVASRFASGISVGVVVDALQCICGVVRTAPSLVSSR